MEPLAADDPRVLGGYRLLGRLGAGGMGRVYLGRSAGGRTVAVKAVHAHFAVDDQFRARFRREIESARRVGGAWTAPVLDADPDAAVPWVATGYAAGPSLAQAVAGLGPLAEHSVRALGAGLAEALAAVHALGLVHRDVKPSNVLLTLDGPLLIDFGIARATEGTASLTSTGVSVGSPGYMAPEQILGNGAAGAADVFSLGAVLAFAATGVSPFSGDSSAALLYKVVHEEPELGSPLVGDLRELVAGCLAKNPADRPAPEALAARLAGEGSGGAAGLVRAGWLPGPLVERVSRQAVELLNLDAGEGTEAGAPAATIAGPAGVSPGGAFGPPDPSYGAAGGPLDPSYGAASGLVPFESAPPAGPPGQAPGAAGLPGVPGRPPGAPPGPPPGPPLGTPPGPPLGAPLGAPPGAPPGPPLGAPPGPPLGAPTGAPPGPPPPQPASWPVAGGVPSAAATGHGHPATAGSGHPATAGSGHPGAADSGRQPAGPGIADLPTGAPPAAAKERRIALSGAVGGEGRPRRMSCTLVLSVAGALAVATTAGFVFRLMPGMGGDTDSGAQTGAKPPADGAPTARPTGPGGAGSGRATVAKPFLGTWTGSVTTAHGIPNGTITSVIKPGGKGDYVIHTTYDAVLVKCRAKAKLEAATKRRLVLMERPDGKQGPGCTGNKSRVTYTLGKGGTLGFASQDDAGGTPKATLTKH
ncbi:serine/threonine protein kinase [Streptomyces decoyicus]|uniref:serine/threonine-protein kinase n=1 Tax=Streptomyces decoyicus TaxID=249567 RepID=UPI001CA45080|nr:serine/threonine-protein kinase [Streptomyces decoyicus]QZY16752.1 serine/threonine protein kinase [Streptomyces decoyicus]